MIGPVAVTDDNAGQYFTLELFDGESPVEAFECRISEYSDYLREDAFCAQDDHVAQTWLLREVTSGGIAAYMSLIADAVKLSNAEKELHRLHYPFKTIPAIKIAKLAVDESFRQQYKGLGSYMILQADQFARNTINPYCWLRTCGSTPSPQSLREWGIGSGEWGKTRFAGLAPDTGQ